MRIFGCVGEDGGGLFVKASEFGKTFEEFLETVGTPGLVLDGWGFVNLGEPPSVWGGLDDIDEEFIDSIKRSPNIVYHRETADDENLLRAFEYDVPDDSLCIDWGCDVDDPDLGLDPAAYPISHVRAFTAVCSLVSPVPAPEMETDED